MEGLNISTLFGSGAVIITALFLFFQNNGIDKLKKLFNKNQKDIENKIKSINTETNKKIIEIKRKEEELEKKKQQVKELIINAKKEIEETGKIKDTSKLIGGV